MSKPTQMFKFTQLRPVNGIDLYQIRIKHIPLYSEDKDSNLLKSIKEDGLPLGIYSAIEYIENSEFLNRFNEFKLPIKDSDNTNLKRLIFVLQETITFSEKFATLNDKDFANIKHVLQQSRSIKKTANLNLDDALKELNNISKSIIQDDCYALLLCSSYYPEYRRYLITQYRLLFFIKEYKNEDIFKVLFPYDTNLTNEELLIYKRFLTGRILLPIGVPTNIKPDTSTSEDDNDNTFNISEQVGGISLPLPKEKIKVIKIDKKAKNINKKDIK